MSQALIVESPDSDNSIAEALATQNPEIESVRVAPHEALDEIRQHDFDIVLVAMGSIPNYKEWVRTIRQVCAELPILVVSNDLPKTNATVKTLILGAASFVPRNRMSQDLGLTVRRIIALCCVDQEPVTHDFLQETHHHYVMGNERTKIPRIVRHLLKEFAHFRICEQADRVRMAVAIEEALVNAIVHGNLEISSKLRERADDAFEEAIRERKSLEPYRERRVRVHAEFRTDQARIHIADEGPGFAPEDVPDPTDPENLIKPYGRGLLLMRSFMDEVLHNETGNKVTLIKRRAGTPAKEKTTCGSCP